MSASHGPDTAQAVAAHDDDEPINELLPDEPHTPMWLPLVGGVLALLTILAFLLTRPPGKTAEQLSKQSAGAQASAAPPASASAAPGQENAPGTPRPAQAPRPAPMPQPGAPHQGG